MSFANTSAGDLPGVRTMRVLAVQDRELDQITPALTANGFQVAAVVGPNDDLSLHAHTRSTEGVVLDLRSPDAPLLAKLANLSQRRPCPIVLFADRGDVALIRRAVHAGVTAYVVQGLHVSRLKAVMDVARVRFAELRRLEAELETTRRSLIERKAVDRAKGILMDERGMSEHAAYHALRKFAMDQNQRVGDVARYIIAGAEFPEC